MLQNLCREVALQPEDQITLFTLSIRDLISLGPEETQARAIKAVFSILYPALEKARALEIRPKEILDILGHLMKRFAPEIARS